MGSSRPPPTPAHGSTPFDRHAANYAARWGQDPVAQRMRAAVYACAEAAFPRGGRILDAGCGAGIDAAWLVERGYRVVAIDASAGMVAETRSRAPLANARQLPVERADALAAEGPFDGALLNFGVLNCVDARSAARALAGVLRPGATLIAVPMPRFSPTWTLAQLVRGHPRAAAQRLRREVDVIVEGAPVRTRYLSLSDVQEAFSIYFKLESSGGLGLLLPPPGTRWPAPILDGLTRAEQQIRHLPCLRGWGDHLLVVGRRTEAPTR